MTAVQTVWAKILSAMDEESHLMARAGCLPVYDGKRWRVFRASVTIHPGVENCADPAKIDALREQAKNLLEHYPETLPQLDKLGARVRTLVNHRIETFEDVLAWSESIFNVGPSSRQPLHVHETLDIVYDDFVLEVKSGRNPAWVIPAAPRGSGVNVTLDFSVPGSKTRYGPRHEFTRSAFGKQQPKKAPRPPRYRGKTVEGEPQRPRGRPRKDGLIPGSPEAKRADRKKLREREARRAARLARLSTVQEASITEMPRPRRPLVRVGAQRKQATS
jgi:hypothetical protein